MLRNRIYGFIYKRILRPIFFTIDPEDTHDWILTLGKFLGAWGIMRALTRAFFYFHDKALEQKVAGIAFPNPVGLAAGFDKDAVLTEVLPGVGFGFLEIGSITGEPCPGNPKPRLWRLKKSKAIVVYYGLKNEGCERVSRRLAGKKLTVPLGISIAKTNSVNTVDMKNGIDDYAKAYERFIDIGDYITINISCPNSYGGEPFTDSRRLDLLLDRIGGMPAKKPVFLKISPDLTKKEVDDILEVAEKHCIAGFICTNLTKNRKNPKILESSLPVNGGISGKVVEGLADELIGYIYTKTKGRFIIMGCGGVFTAEDAYRKIRLGASLVQLITGMIYEGPHAIGEINHGLVKLLQRDGFTNISEAIGADHRARH